MIFIIPEMKREQHGTTQVLEFYGRVSQEHIRGMHLQQGIHWKTETR